MVLLLVGGLVEVGDEVGGRFIPPKPAPNIDDDHDLL
jgi:hypothetical protein